MWFKKTITFHWTFHPRLISERDVHVMTSGFSPTSFDPFLFRNISNTCSVNPDFHHLDFVRPFYKHSRYCNIHFAWPRINSLPVSMDSHGVRNRGLFGGNCFRKEKVECIDALGYPPTHRFNLWLKGDPIFSPATIFCPRALFCKWNKASNSMSKVRIWVAIWS